MKAYKCDRCGGLYEIGGPQPIFRVEKYEGSLINSYGVDLCPSCSIDFDNFMSEVNNGKEKEN